MEQNLLFEPRFLASYVGKAILSDPKVAIMELIANAWDAGATMVEIIWPNRDEDEYFSIKDNGVGMTENELTERWRTLAYDRVAHQGELAEFPAGLNLPPRKAFGTNGVGRFAGFCFGESYYIDTMKNRKRIIYKVSESFVSTPFTLEKIFEEPTQRHGTIIFVKEFSNIRLSAEEAKTEIGMRFLTDPSFSVFVNGEKVDLHHIPEPHVLQKPIDIEGVGTLELTVIDTLETDRTTKQHGIAWHVNGRLVGDCSWKGTGFSELIDGRRIEAKRYIFIVKADCLSAAVKKDWTGFDESNDAFSRAYEQIFQEVKEFVLNVTKEKRKETLTEVKETYRKELSQMAPFKQKKWEVFVSLVQEECPSITEKDLTRLSGVLAKLELAESKYKLINQLNSLEPTQLDELQKILHDWSIDIAKEVLDELKIRIKLLDELRVRVIDENTDEVHELQPLFHQGLWIFGPEYETIEFTSNEGMTNVIRKLFGIDQQGSMNRPDFVIIPDGSVGTYYYPTYDEHGAEFGVDKLVIVELKKPGVRIGDKEKNQCWKYVTELYRRGLIQQEITRVTCFVLGAEIDPIQGRSRKEMEGKVHILPLSYNIVIERAKSRLLKLYDRVKGAPFLQEVNIEAESPEKPVLPLLTISQ
jgi:hypothetical protein